MTEITAKGWEQHAEACRRRVVLGDTEGAEKAFAAAIAEAEELGPHSRGLAACLTVLAQIRMQQRDHASAEALFRRALEVREQAPEFDHIGIIQVLGHLATLHNARADYDEADALLTRALTLADKFLPSSHPAVASLLNNLARLYFKRTEYAKADRMLVRLLQIKQAQGTEHPEVAGVLASIAALRSALGKHDVAEQLWRRVLAIREKSLPHDDPVLITTLNSLADACAAQGEHEEAQHFRDRGVRLQAQAPAADHARAATARNGAASDIQGTPAASQQAVTPVERIAVQTPSASFVAPAAPPAPAIASPPEPLVPPAPPLSVQQNRITPIPAMPARDKAEPFSPGTSGSFAPFAPPATPGLAGAMPGIGGPIPTPSSVAAAGGSILTPSGNMPGIGASIPTPSAVPAGMGGRIPTPAAGLPGIGGAVPTQARVMPGIGGSPPEVPGGITDIAGPAVAPEPRRPSMPAEIVPPFGRAETPAAAAPKIPAAPPLPPKPAPREPTPPPPRRRSEPSAERPRYDLADDAPYAPRRIVGGKVLTGLALAAGIGFAALALGRGKDVAPVEAAVADTAKAEERVIRIPAESLKVGQSRSAGPAPASAISLDSALAASRARNAVDSGPTVRAAAAADSGTRPVVVPSARTLDALSRAVDAGLKSSVDSAVRAPAALKTPGFRSPE